MTYTSRRPRLFLPRNELFVPNALTDGLPSNSLWSTATVTANRAYYLPFSAPYDTAVKSISVVYVVSASGNYDLGLYDSAGTRLGSLGSTAVSTVGTKTWTPSTPIGVKADTTYYAAVVNSAALTAYCDTSVGRTYCVLIQESAIPLPSTWTTPTFPISAAINYPFLKITFSG